MPEKPKRFIVLLIAVAAMAFPAHAVSHPKKLKQKREHWLLREFPQLKAPKPKPPEIVGLSLRHQNEIADRYGLPRIQNSEELAALKESGYLVRAKMRYLCFEVDQQLAKKKFKVPMTGPKNKKIVKEEDLLYLNPAEENYIGDNLAEEYCESDAAYGGKNFIISSLVRTEEYQRFLARRNPNASEALGDTNDSRSSHLTGYTFDISARGHSKKELRELARILVRDKGDGENGLLTEVIFEPSQNNFHVMVNPRRP